MMSSRLMNALLTPFVCLASALLFNLSAAAQYQGVSQEDQEKLRDEFETTSFISHFFEMDTSGDWATTLEEMDTYFTRMFYTFDRDRNGIVSVEEAPTLLLQIRLMGKPYPTEGLDLEELRYRLGETFKFLDKNNNDKLGWPEML